MVKNGVTKHVMSVVASAMPKLRRLREGMEDNKEELASNSN
jgi:hypothetical protein